MFDDAAPPRLPLSRRDFAKVAAATLLLPDAGATAGGSPAGATGADVSGDTWPGYERSMVIDMLATAAPFNVPYTFARPLTAEMVSNARTSGITAVNATVSGTGIGGQPFESSVSNIAFWEREFDAHPDVFLKIETVADLRRAKESRRVGVILGFQDGTMFGDDIARVDLFQQLGVRIVQLTYNVRNLLGDGCLESANAGLSAFGRRAVARMNDLGVLVDTSHCGRQTTRDAITVSKKPIAVTHSACSAVNDVPRNKPDELLRLLAERGGVIGIYLMPFLRAQGQPRDEDFLKHVEHAVNVCGEDHVGIGSDLSITPLALTPEFRTAHADFVKQRRQLGISAPGEAEDIFNYVPDFNSPRRMELIADALARAGHPSSRIEKILGANWVRLLTDVWG